VLTGGWGVYMRQADAPQGHGELPTEPLNPTLRSPFIDAPIQDGAPLLAPKVRVAGVDPGRVKPMTLACPTVCGHSPIMGKKMFYLSNICAQHAG
jgi:hypothetical protein